MSRLLFENPEYIKEILISDTISILKKMAEDRLIPKKYVLICRSVLKDSLILSPREVVGIKAHLHNSITFANGEPYLNLVRFFTCEIVQAIEIRAWSLLIKEIPVLAEDLKLYRERRFHRPINK